jgi:hypothetical protein
MYRLATLTLAALLGLAEGGWPRSLLAQQPLVGAQ